MISYRINFDNKQQAIDAEKRYLLGAEGNVAVRRQGAVLIITPPVLVATLLGVVGVLYQLFSRLYRRCLTTDGRRKKTLPQQTLRSE